MPYSRISARKGQQVRLCTTFYRNGVPTDPYAIRKIEIYRNSVVPHNLVATVVFTDPCDPLYPSPATVDTEDLPAGECGTGPITGSPIPGKYCYDYDVPADAVAPDVYIDVWYYYPDNPCDLPDYYSATDCVEQTDGSYCHADLDSASVTGLLQTVCNRFWVYPDQWFAGDGLQSIRFSFEPLDQKFNQPEVRPLEVGIMPLPLYDFNYNLNMPIIPYLSATIKVETRNKEVLVNNEPMEIALRQGSYRTNPFVFRWTLDTSNFLIGTYSYRITVTLPDGSTRASGDYIFTVA